MKPCSFSTSGSNIIVYIALGKDDHKSLLLFLIHIHRESQQIIICNFKDKIFI